MKTVKGDLIELTLQGEFDVIVQGCNCQCVMGKGLAKSIKETFPAVYEADLKTIKGDRHKLGKYSWAKVKLPNGKQVIIINAYIQFWYSSKPNDCMLSYDAFNVVMNRIAQTFKGKRIGMPKIGSKLAGGDWKILSKLLNDHFKNHDLTIVEYSE